MSVQKQLSRTPGPSYTIKTDTFQLSRTPPIIKERGFGRTLWQSHRLITIDAFISTHKSVCPCLRSSRLLAFQHVLAHNLLETFRGAKAQATLHPIPPALQVMSPPEAQVQHLLPRQLQRLLRHLHQPRRLLLPQHLAPARAQPTLGAFLLPAPAPVAESFLLRSGAETR
jgi:hypothetical protein